MNTHEQAEHAGTPTDARAFWDARYGERPQIWSGSANRVLVDVASTLEPGRALDLGCGEGGDSLWLAEAGWHTTGVDISATALERARGAARDRGIDESRLDWQGIDLATGFPDGRFDLVSACFLASPVHLPRADVLRRAAATVTPGGTLLVVSHAAPPPWAHRHAHAPHDFPSPQDELDVLALDGQDWEVVTAETRQRGATGPDGEAATLEDTVVVVRRR